RAPDCDAKLQSDRSFGCAVADVRLEPVKDALVQVNAMLGWSGDQEEVALPWITHQLNLATGALERREHLLGLSYRTALILFAVNDERRRLRAVRECRRRHLREHVRLFPRRRRSQELAGLTADVRRA